MKYINADLTADVVNVYDQTKTTRQGNVHSKTINSQTVLGPAVNVFVDTVADTAGQTVPIISWQSDNGRLFSIGAEATGFSLISLHEIDQITGVKTYVGQIRIALADLAATTHTLADIKVLDTGTTGWKVFVLTRGSVTINGGLYMVNNIDKADFIPVGSTTIPFANGNNQKAVYFLQDPAAIGAGQLNITGVGLSLDTVGNQVFVHDGVSATHRYFVYSTSASPTWVTNTVTGTEATNTINDAGHTFVNGSQVTFSSLTGGTGFTVGTTYFVVGAVAGVSYQLAATSGGAAINFTTDITTATIGRAFGITGSNFVHKTGLLPALTGTLLTASSEDYALPGHTTNAGQPCIFLATSSNLYLGRISELTSGATTWPSLVASNLLGTVNQITTPTATFATWSNILDRAVYLTNGNIFVMKQIVNNSIDYIFGGANNEYNETFTSNTIELGFITITSLDIANGWLVVTGSTVGQRGVFLSDLRSDKLFDYSYIVTKVLNTPNSVYKFLTSLEELYAFTGTLSVEYRTSGFGSISGGWTPVAFAQDLTALAPGDQVQFKIRFDTLGLDTCIPAQVNDLILGYDALDEISDHWEFNRDQSSNLSPSRSVFRLKSTYSSSVPSLSFRAYDLSNVLLVNHNTVSNTSNFQYSTDNGSTWNSLGTIPNTVGTLVRYTFTSAPGVDIRVSLKET